MSSMKKVLFLIATMIIIPMVCFSQNRSNITHKYGLASFHYFIPGTGAIWAGKNAVNIGGSFKYGIQMPFSGTTPLFFDTGIGLGLMSYKDDHFEEAEVYPYIFIPISIGYKLGLSNSLFISPHVGVAGVIGLPDFNTFSIGGMAPTLGLTVMASRLLVDISYNLPWLTNSYQSGYGNFSLGLGWSF